MYKNHLGRTQTHAVTRTEPPTTGAGQARTVEPLHVQPQQQLARPPLALTSRQGYIQQVPKRNWAPVRKHIYFTIQYATRKYEASGITYAAIGRPYHCLGVGQNGANLGQTRGK